MDKELGRVATLDSKLEELALGEKELEERKSLLVAEHQAFKK